PVDLQPEVVVPPRRPVPLDDEDAVGARAVVGGGAASAVLGGLPARLRGPPEVPHAPIGAQGLLGRRSRLRGRVLLRGMPLARHPSTVPRGRGRRAVVVRLLLHTLTGTGDLS